MYCKLPKRPVRMAHKPGKSPVAPKNGKYGWRGALLLYQSVFFVLI
ncbi:hypothetical protein PXO_00694 [Xanthomonas oryzae pv. oryzae PXO99A]|uniref:Uncharacterized protein n=1 Tax=Xanthomonas oryzae pv. oryzae (strain PXO99A) TaxID=360094 RepID=A0A0K0GKN0_XANOP|nr:hypothetical protein PXO_00694 [Xanthomonas oryzae pv. oryzae PXO99A]